MLFYLRIMDCFHKTESPDLPPKQVLEYSIFYKPPPSCPCPPENDESCCCITTYIQWGINRHSLNTVTVFGINAYGEVSLSHGLECDGIWHQSLWRDKLELRMIPTQWNCVPGGTFMEKRSREAICQIWGVSRKEGREKGSGVTGLPTPWSWTSSPQDHEKEMSIVGAAQLWLSVTGVLAKRRKGLWNVSNMTVHRYNILHKPPASEMD